MKVQKNLALVLALALCLSLLPAALAAENVVASEQEETQTVSDQYDDVKTFTGGFRWRNITDPEADEYVADQFADDAKFYWNGTERTKSDFEEELEPKTYCLSMSDGYIPGLVVKFYCDGNREIGVVEVIEHSVAQLTAQVETRVTAEGILQVKVPGLVGDWTNADQVLGYQGLTEGDVVLYYTVGDGAERTYIMEKAEKITGRVAMLNTKGQIRITNDTPDTLHGRTGLQTVPASVTLGFDHPAYTNGNNTFAHWPVATAGNTYDFFLDKNGDVCFIQKARFVPVTGVFIYWSESGYYMEEGTTRTLSAAVIPVDAENQTIYWTCEDTAVLTVDRLSGKLTAHKAGTATVTVTTDDGGFTATCSVTVTKAPSSGGGSSSSGGSSGGGGGGSSSGSSGGGSPAPAPTPAASKPASEKFTDVAKDSWYEAGVTYVTDKGLFNGMADGVFAPNTNMTRAMLMTVLARLDGQDTNGGETWYSKGMDWAVAKGVSDGTKPESNVTREQLVTMLYRYAKATAVAGDLTSFADGDSVSGWAVEAMAWAVKQGIVTGKDGSRLDPQGTATRAEVATIIQRFVENK